MGWFRNLGRDRPWAQGCVITGAGLVLSVSGCFGFLVTLNLHGGGSSGLQEALNVLGAIAFGLGGIVFLAGLVWWLVALARGGKRRAGAPPPPPPAPPAPRRRRAEHAAPHAALSLLRRRADDLFDLLPAARRQDRLRGRRGLPAQALRRARRRARAGGRRRRLLPALPRGLPQAAGDAGALQHPGALGLSLRLRPLHRPRAALLPDPHRDLRRLQPRLPDLLLGERPAPARIPLARRGGADARRGGGQRGRARRGADLGRRAGAAPGALRDSRRRAAAADPPPDAQHQRRAPRRGRGVRRAPGRLRAGVRGLPAVRLAARERRCGPCAVPICGGSASGRSSG